MFASSSFSFSYNEIFDVDNVSPRTRRIYCALNGIMCSIGKNRGNLREIYRIPANTNCRHILSLRAVFEGSIIAMQTLILLRLACLSR